MDNFRFLNFHTVYKSKGTITKDRIEGVACFSDIFRGPNKQHNTYEIHVFKTNEKIESGKNNMCVLSRLEIVRYIKLLKKLIPYKLKSRVIEDDEKYIIKLQLNGSNIAHRFVLSFIRYLYEWPYNMYLHDALKLNRIKEFRFKSIFNLFNLVRITLPIYEHGTGIHAIGDSHNHYKFISNRKLKELIKNTKNLCLNDMMKNIAFDDKRATMEYDISKTKELSFWISDKEFNERLNYYKNNVKLLK